MVVVDYRPCKLDFPEFVDDTTVGCFMRQYQDLKKDHSKVSINLWKAYKEIKRLKGIEKENRQLVKEKMELLEELWE